MGMGLNGRRIAASIVAGATALGAGMVLALGQGPVVETDAAATDSVNFSHEAQALMFYADARYRETHTEGDGVLEATWDDRDTPGSGDASRAAAPSESEHSVSAHSGTGPEPLVSPENITVGSGPGKYGEACAAPHGASPECAVIGHPVVENQPLTASTRNGSMEWLDWTDALLGVTRVRAGLAEDSPQGIVTGTECTPDGHGGVTLAGYEPYAVVEAGGGGLLSLFDGDPLSIDVRAENPVAGGGQGATDTPDPGSFRTETAGFQGHSIQYAVPGLNGHDIELNYTTEWGQDDTSAWSRIMIQYRATNFGLLGGSVSPWVTYEAQSECGIGTPPGAGTFSLQQQPYRASLSVPAPRVAPTPTATPEETAEPESTTETAETAETAESAAPPAGVPQDSGFVDEDTVVTASRREYHLLADQPLVQWRREETLAVIEDAAAADSSFAGTSGLSTWTLYPEDSRSPVPVIEIVLSDNTLIQARPIVDGAVLPGPDVEVDDDPELPASTEVAE